MDKITFLHKIKTTNPKSCRKFLFRCCIPSRTSWRFLSHFSSWFSYVLNISKMKSNNNYNNASQKKARKTVSTFICLCSDIFCFSSTPFLCVSLPLIIEWKIENYSIDYLVQTQTDFYELRYCKIVHLTAWLFALRCTFAVCNCIWIHDSKIFSNTKTIYNRKHQVFGV